MVADPQGVEALKLLQDFARSRRALLGEKALTEFQSTYGRDADTTCLWDAICDATEAEIHGKTEPDHRGNGNTVIKLKLPVLGRRVYVKATMNLERKDRVYIISCHP